MEKKPLNPIDVQIGQNIKAYRVERNLTQAQLAAAIREPLTHQAIAFYESGSIRVSASSLVDIATVLQVPVGYLFDGVAGILQAHEAPVTAETRLKDEKLLASIRGLKDEEVQDAVRNMTQALVKGVTAALTKGK